MNNSKYQNYFELFEPLLDWDEELITANYFRETPNCLHYLFFKLFAALYTRNYYVALTNKRVIVIPFPMSGILTIKNHFSANYRDVTIDEYEYQIYINVIGLVKPLSLKFGLITSQKIKDDFLTKLNQEKSKEQNR